MSTKLVQDRNAGLKIGYLATNWSNPVSFEDFAKVMQSWDVQAIKRNDEVIGAAFFKDGEVHASILPQWRGRWITRSILRDLFKGERVTTRVTPGHDYMNDILKRLGFVRLPDGTFLKEAQHGY